MDLLAPKSRHEPFRSAWALYDSTNSLFTNFCQPFQPCGDEACACQTRGVGHMAIPRAPSACFPSPSSMVLMHSISCLCLGGDDNSSNQKVSVCEHKQHKYIHHLPFRTYFSMRKNCLYVPPVRPSITTAMTLMNSSWHKVALPTMRMLSIFSTTCHNSIW